MKGLIASSKVVLLELRGWLVESGALLAVLDEVVPAPAWVSKLSNVIVLSRVTSLPYQKVESTATAENLSPGPDVLSSVRVLLRLGLHAPVV